MELELSLPLSIRGRPKHGGPWKMLQVVSKRRYDIPSVNAEEVTRVFRAKYSFGSNLGRDINDVIQYGEHLYRPLGTISSAVNNYFSWPYHASKYDLHCDQGINVHFANKVLLRKQLGLEPTKIWPTPNRGEDFRDVTVLEQVLPLIDEINIEDLSEAEQCLTKASNGLVIVAGRLWCRTDEPKIRVELTEIDDASKYHVVVSPWYENPYPCRHYNTSQRLFSLDDENSARVYAEALRASSLPHDRNRDILYKSGIAPVLAASLFDGETAQLRAISRQLAYAVSIRYAKIKEDSHRLSDQQVSLIENATNSLLAENYVLGRPFDMSTEVRDLFELWRTMGKPHAREVLCLRTILADSLIEKMIDELEPIAPDFWSKPHSDKGTKP